MEPVLASPLGTSPMNPKSEPPVKLICPHCGSDDVSGDACARWDIATQDWDLTAVYDSKNCETCGELKYLDEEPLSDEEMAEYLAEQKPDPQAQITGLLAANSQIVLKGRTLKRMLEKARDQFAFYAANHRAKNTKDGDEKAEINDRMVAEIQKTLNEYHVIERDCTATV